MEDRILSQTLQSPQIIYSQTDPKNWDPFSRANRIALVHDYCVHPNTDDDALRAALDFMELKVESALETNQQADVEVAVKEKHRNLFNYQYVSVPERREINETARTTKFSHVSEYLLNCIQISEIALTRGLRRAAHKCRYYQAKMINSPWLEEQFLESQSETTNTFLLVNELERELVKIRSNSTSVPDWRMPKELSTETLNYALSMLQQKSLFKFDDILRSEIASNQVEFLLDSANRTALFAINHEIIENAMSHGVASSINPHVAGADDQDFGKLFYLQTSTETFTETGASDTGIFPETFGQYHVKRGSKKRGRRQDYRIITYFDSGLGLQAHFEKFGDLDHKPSIKEIATGHLSTRPIIGSGQGIYKMKNFAESLGAFLTIATSDSTYTFDGHQQVENETSVGQIRRGTIVSIFLPEK